MVGVFNPTDFTDFNPNGTYLAGAQLSYAFEKGAVYLNTLMDGDFMQLDLTTTYAASDNLNLGLNATNASDNFYGAAIYANYKTSESLSFGIRSEYFKDNGLGLLDLEEPASTENDVLDLTLSANIKLGNLRIIPEFRMDMFSADLVVPDFTKVDRKDKLSSFLLAAVYAF
jgi:Putative beta-barrel porin-2, OmpL-like. bbp2